MNDLYQEKVKNIVSGAKFYKIKFVRLFTSLLS